MCTGIFSRAQISQTGSSSGSSSFSRVPSVFFAVRPKFFKISPRPFAPAFTSSSICFAVRAPNPGPTGSRKLIVVNATMRSGYGLCLIDVEHLRQAVAGGTRHVHHQLQVLAVHRLDDGGVGVSGDRSRASERVPVDVHHRKLRARHGVLRHDERRARLVFADARRRKLGFAALRPAAGEAVRVLRLRGDHGQRTGGDERERRGARGQVAEHKGSQRAVSRILFPAFARLRRSGGRRPFL